MPVWWEKIVAIVLATIAGVISIKLQQYRADNKYKPMKQDNDVENSKSKTEKHEYKKSKNKK